MAIFNFPLNPELNDRHTYGDKAWIWNGTVWKVDRSSGGGGADGKSAYEIALDNGFEGTEAEWLESLKSSDGPENPKEDLLYAQSANGWVGMMIGGSGGNLSEPVDFSTIFESNYIEYQTIDPEYEYFQKFTNTSEFAIAITNVGWAMEYLPSEPVSFRARAAVDIFRSNQAGEPDFDSGLAYTEQLRSLPILSEEPDILINNDNSLVHVIQPNETVWFTFYIDTQIDEGDVEGAVIQVASYTSESESYSRFGPAVRRNKTTEVYEDTDYHIVFFTDAAQYVDHGNSVALVDEAPLDSGKYVRTNGSWEDLGEVATFPEANEWDDGRVLTVTENGIIWADSLQENNDVWPSLRYNGGWKPVTTGEGFGLYRLTMESGDYYAGESTPRTTFSQGWYGTKFTVPSRLTPSYHRPENFRPTTMKIYGLSNFSSRSLTFGIWTDENGKPGRQVYENTVHSRHDMPDDAMQIDLHLPYGVTDYEVFDANDTFWVGVVLGWTDPIRFPESINQYIPEPRASYHPEMYFISDYHIDFDDPTMVFEEGFFVFDVHGYDVNQTSEGFSVDSLVTESPVNHQIYGRRAEKWESLTPYTLFGSPNIGGQQPDESFRILGTNKYDESIWLDPSDLFDGTTIWHEDVSGGVNANYGKVEIGRGLKGIEMAETEFASAFMRLESRGISLHTSSDLYPSLNNTTTIGTSNDIIFKPGNGIVFGSGNSGSDNSIYLSIGVRDASTSQSGLLSASDKAKLNGLNGASYATLSASSNTFTGSVNVLYPTSGNNAATKQYVDDAVATRASTAVATTSAAGLMSSADKTKLNGLSAVNLTGYAQLAGATFTGEVNVPAPTTNTHAATKKYVDDNLATKAGTATATTSAPGLMSATDKTKLDGLANANLTGYAQLSGATFTGAVNVPTPTADTHSSTKKYVDDGLAVKAGTATATTSAPGLMSAADKTKLNGLNDVLYAKLSGATFTGAISGTTASFSGVVSVAAPTAAGHATTKTYVDNLANGKLNLTGGTLTGGVVLSGGNGIDASGMVSAVTPGTSTSGGVRIRADAANTHAVLQFTNNAISTQWGAMVVNSGGWLTWDGGLNVTGGMTVSGTITFTDQLSLPANPTADAHAARKAYVDTLISGQASKTGKSQALDAGFIPSTAALTGTSITPTAATNNWFTYTNSAAFTLNVPPHNGSFVIAVTNAATGMGAMTASGYSKVVGTFKTTANFKQWLRIERIGSHISLYIEDAQ